MPNIHCALDTSALLKRYTREPGSPIIDSLFESENCARHILNITITEVYGAFLRWQLAGSVPPQKRKELRDLFKKDVQQHILITHDIQESDISRSNTIYDTSIQVPAPTYVDHEGQRREKPRIGPADVLVLSMCQELKQDYGEINLFTADEHMLKVAEKLGIKAWNPEQLKQLPFE
jgi:predicted nucleic acid-binding protein